MGPQPTVRSPVLGRLVLGVKEVMREWVQWGRKRW